MDSDAYEDILKVLLHDLSAALENTKAKHALQDVQKAYMTAAKKHYELNRKTNTSPLVGS